VLFVARVSRLGARQGGIDPSAGPATLVIAGEAVDGGLCAGRKEQADIRLRRYGGQNVRGLDALPGAAE